MPSPTPTDCQFYFRFLRSRFLIGADGLQVCSVGSEGNRHFKISVLVFIFALTPYRLGWGQQSTSCVHDSELLAVVTGGKILR